MIFNATALCRLYAFSYFYSWDILTCLGISSYFCCPPIIHLLLFSPFCYLNTIHHISFLNHDFQNTCYSHC